ncbi:HEPN domain-containing protein [Tardiphaga sp. 804_B3_N1_9]|uniref:HEPN domain-containing protein n=1 Tax=Tardiphaga sp. 804_B3_N1_9 TaxID=3240786 RepID=UPI003F224CC2
MPSLAFGKFEGRILEVKRLLSLCTPEDADYRIKRENTERDDALLRGAHVLLCSHLEGFFEDLISDLIDVYDKLVTKVNVLPEELRAHQVLGPVSRWKVEDKDKRWAAVQAWAVHPLIKIGDDKRPGSLEAGVHIDGFSNPGSNEIEWLFKTVGLGGIWDLFKTIEPDQVVVQSINVIVNRRNQIAHGKADATITLGDELIYVERAERIAEVFEQIVSQDLNGRLRIADCWVELERASA